VPRFVRLTPPDWRITREALAEAFTERTRLVVFNNPHNPTARMFGAEELALLAEACVASDALALTDEVWEHVVFDGRRHIPLSTLPAWPSGRSRSARPQDLFAHRLEGRLGAGAVGAGRGGRQGAPVRHLFDGAQSCRLAVAYGLGKPPGDLERTCAAFAVARDRLKAGLEARGYAPLPAEGTYFITIDLTASGIAAGDVEFCERAVREAGRRGDPDLGLSSPRRQ
jgi:aspartate/methionine/tyrosine aminotransferase